MTSDKIDGLKELRWNEFMLAHFLTAPEMAPTLNKLSNAWIFTVPEFLSVVGAVKRTVPPPMGIIELKGALEVLDKRCGENFDYDWVEYKKLWIGETSPNLPLLSVSDPTLRYAEMVTATATRDIPSKYFIESRFPIRDQQEEGACVAHAIAAVVEHILQRPLSDEEALELYEASRNIDGARNPDGGTQIGAALNIAQQRNLWPGALVLAPGAIPHLKETLADGAPIVVGLRVFASVAGSSASRLSGKWTLPIDGEAAVGAHAMALFGYQDDASAPGGGYFIARNSWGEDYARQSPNNRPGYALIPYRYVQLYCGEAYAPEVNKPAPKKPFAPKDEFERRYAWVLQDQARDLDGALINAGATVVGRKEERSLFKRDDPSTREAFMKNGYSWNAAGRIRAFFPTPTSEEFKKERARRIAASDEFFNVVEANLKALVGSPSTLSRPGFFGGKRKIERVEELKEESGALSATIRDEIALANGLKIKTGSALESLEYGGALKATRARAWRVSDGKSSALVVACFFAPMTYARESEPRFVDADENALQKGINAIGNWFKTDGKQDEFACAAFGAYNEDFGTKRMASEFAGLAASSRSGYCRAAVAGSRESRWRSTFGAVADERARELSRRLTPTGMSETVARVFEVATDPGYQGDVTVAYVKRKLADLSSDEIERAFDELVSSGDFEERATYEGERGITRRGR